MVSAERAKQIMFIHSHLPETVFTTFTSLLTYLNEDNQDKLIYILSRCCDPQDSLDNFTYAMPIKAKTRIHTPVNEILDLLEGWIITSVEEIVTDGNGDFIRYIWRAFPLRP